jgi:hypothetical protein
MKKLLLVLFALTFVATASFAQITEKSVAEKSAAPVKAVAKGVEKVGEYVGKVVSVTVAEPTKGVMDSTVKVSDDMGNPVSFTVKSTAKIVDASLNVITLNQLKEGSKVKVKAEKTAAGKEEATAIAVQ